ncbi:ribosomal protein 60S [Coniochaeta ligniaria NRRL 30616]|uniref:Large ribosomal subunit protein P1 n=1 Tax=Coniochaeta ligniaria NRRL 30616 TaxID=1408157 RepID=A0A1J7IQV0_9PEZI|nr:ribosomal protein 60S [Coniochaeta ligniaria NRRL 30616]
MSTAELATSYAALILADDGVEITADKINTLIKAANVPDVEPIWASLFAKALEGKDVKDLLSNVGSGGGAPAQAASGGAAAAGGAAEETKEEEKVEGQLRFPRSLRRHSHTRCDVAGVCLGHEEQLTNQTRITEKEESDDDMGFGLFD